MVWADRDTTAIIRIACRARDCVPLRLFEHAIACLAIHGDKGNAHS